MIDAAASVHLRSPFKLLVVTLIAAIGVAALLSLGFWQLQRLEWKRALIERVEKGAHAEPIVPPVVATTDSEYRRVQLTGRYAHDREAQVLAVTALGRGYWVMTPLDTPDGRTFLINRGFVTTEYRNPARRPGGQIEGPTTVTGLWRLSEPGGGFLRTNDRRADRWYSRDVAAIAESRGVRSPAAGFIDADAVDLPDAHAPRGGMTVLVFNNNHLQYAITWLVLAVMLAGGWAWALRYEWQLRRSR